MLGCFRQFGHSKLYILVGWSVPMWGMFVSFSVALSVLLLLDLHILFLHDFGLRPCSISSSAEAERKRERERERDTPLFTRITFCIFRVGSKHQWIDQWMHQWLRQERLRQWIRQWIHYEESVRIKQRPQQHVTLIDALLFLLSFWPASQVIYISRKLPKAVWRFPLRAQRD